MNTISKDYYNSNYSYKESGGTDWYLIEKVNAHNEKNYKQNPEKGLFSSWVTYTSYQQVQNRRVGLVSDGKKYLKSITTNNPSVVMNENIVGGMPVIKGTRIPIAVILSCFRDEMKIEEICEDYFLTKEEVKSSIDYTISVLNKPFHEE